MLSFNAVTFPISCFFLVTEMRKITTVDVMTTGLHTPTQVTLTANRLFKIISLRKDDRYSTEIFTKKFDTSTNTFTEMKSKN